jgi:hypothetical protein
VPSEDLSVDDYVRLPVDRPEVQKKPLATGKIGSREGAAIPQALARADAAGDAG